MADAEAPPIEPADDDLQPLTGATESVADPNIDYSAPPTPPQPPRGQPSTKQRWLERAFSFVLGAVSGAMFVRRRK